MTKGAETGCLWCGGIGTLEATDIFCGAGGSSNGLEFVVCPLCGRQLIKVTQALNHWDLAVQAHNANFPDADHDVHDVEELPASRFRRTPIAWFSPECTHHAYCRGPKDGGEDGMRSRATFGDIVRFTEYHKYDAVIVENVIEARLWCDVKAHGKKCSCGYHFDRWFKAICKLGYEGQVVYFNSQFTLTPQSRDRMYIVFWRKGARKPMLDFRPLSWCGECEEVVRGIQTWKKATRGSVRTQPGKHEYGRYGQQYLYTCPHEGCEASVSPAVVGSKTIIDWDLPAERIGDKDRPLAAKTRQRIKAGLEKLDQLRPQIVPVGGHLHERRPGVRVWSVDRPLRTVHTTRCQALVTPAGGQEANARSVEEPSHAVVGSDRLAVSLRVGGQSAAPATSEEPTSTITAHDRQRAVVIPNREHNKGSGAEEPMGAVTTGEGQKMLVEFHQHGTGRSTEVPAHTLRAEGHHHGVLVYNGNPGHVRDLAEPAGTVTSRDHHALLVPFKKDCPARPTDVPTAPITTRDYESLLMPYYGTGVARPVEIPTGAVTTRDREALVVSEADIDDCLFRMLQWPELLRAQQMHERADGSTYKLEARVRGKNGKYRDLSNELKVKMIGNAVSSPVATMLGYAVVGALR